MMVKFQVYLIDLVMMKVRDPVRLTRIFIIKFILLMQKLLDLLIFTEMEC